MHALKVIKKGFIKQLRMGKNEEVEKKTCEQRNFEKN